MNASRLPDLCARIDSLTAADHSALAELAIIERRQSPMGRPSIAAVCQSCHAPVRVSCYPSCPSPVIL